MPLLLLRSLSLSCFPRDSSFLLLVSGFDLDFLAGLADTFAFSTLTFLPLISTLSFIAASTDSAEEDSAEADDTAAEAESTGEDSASSDSTEADSAEVADSKETEAAGSSAGTAAQTANSDAYGEVVSAAGWNITVEDVEINSSLENVSVELGYTGVETSDYKKEADAGKTFCMIKLKIEKDGSKETLDWANLKLTDSEGNEYSRMDDEFISELGMTRMAGTTLNFGSNEGWIAFEIDENAEGLELSYPFEAEEYHCAL